MNTLSETIKDTPKKGENFFNYIFSFSDENKCEILNLFQYTTLAIIPTIIILKLIKNYIPSEEETKGNLEITVECILQLLLVVFFIWFSDRLIRYVPTYSECEYVKYDSISFIMPLVIILFTMQTKLGAKINILFDRAVSYWNGESEIHQQPQKQNNMRVLQPLQQQHEVKKNMNEQLLPSNMDMTRPPKTNEPDFNQMYESNNTPLVGANTPSMNNDYLSANSFGDDNFTSW